MAEAKTMECVICLNDFKKKQIIECGFCEYVGCVTCSRRCILNQTNDPCCPNCNHAWDLNFTREHLGKSFMNKEYKIHKKQLLFDIEVSKIPQTMELVERETKKEEINQDINYMQEKVEQLQQQIRELGTKIYNKRYDLRKLNNKKVERKEFKLKCPFPECGGFISNNYVCAICKNKTCKDCYEIMEREKTLNEAKREVWTYTHTCNPASVESFKLIKKETRGCPNCATRISKISGCDQMWCTECHVAFSWTTGRKVTGTIHNPHYYEWHKQNKHLDKLRNPAEILCGGLPNVTILHGIVDTLKNTLKYNVTGSYIPYKGGCGQNYARFGYLPIGKPIDYNSNSEQKQSFSYTVDHPEYRSQIEFVQLMINLHQKISHFQNNEVHGLRTKVRDINIMDDFDRCKFIRKQTSEDGFKRSIMKKHKKKQKLIKILHIYEMGYVTIIETYNEIFRTIQTIYLDCAEHRKIMQDLVYQCQREKERAYYNDVYKPWEDNVRTVENKKIIDLFDRFYKIVNYCNRELYKVSELYSQVVPFIGISTTQNLGVKNYWKPERYPNYNLLTSIDLKYDNKIFQLYKTVVTEKSVKNIKIKDETQMEHLNNNPFFNFNDIFIFTSRYNEAYRNGQSSYRYVNTTTSLKNILNNVSCSLHQDGYVPA